jgi:hypothetical protein
VLLVVQADMNLVLHQHIVVMVVLVDLLSVRLMLLQAKHF